MIGLDTNVLVRYLTRDELRQYAKAAAFIADSAAKGEHFVVNSAVLCELVWVLASAYEYSRDEIAHALEQIFATAQFEIERLDEARQALSDFRRTKADFSDALIGRINQALGAESTATFDRELKGIETFRVL
jgi:predicted nucleic-acid-binding protein